MDQLTTKPEIKYLDDGSIGYFYSLQQIELIRDLKIKNTEVENIPQQFNRHSGSALNCDRVLSNKNL